MAKNNDELKFEIIDNLGIISPGTKGWNRELNRVSWNGAAPKYDIRDWDETHTKMGKGITLTEEGLRNLRELIDKEIAALDNSSPA